MSSSKQWQSRAEALGWIIPQWPAPAHVHAVCTTRAGGVSQPPFAGFNLGDHVGDDQNTVASNRQQLRQLLALPSEPLWLTQVHGVAVADTQSPGAGECQADASIVHQAGQVSIIMTADCLPVLFCDQQGREVASAHAGWRGLCDGVLEATVARFNAAPDTILAWLGPAIGPDAFEVGDEVREAFMQHDAQAVSAFKATAKPGKWMADIYRLAEQRLRAAGISAIYGGEFCTYHDRERFFSYRRDGQTGRMASLIWLD